MKQGLYRPTPDPSLCQTCKTEWTMCGCDLGHERQKSFKEGFRSAWKAAAPLIVILIFCVWMAACLGRYSVQDRLDAESREKQSNPYHQREELKP